MVKFKSPAETLADLVKGGTAKWAKQRKAEERDAQARRRRDDRMVRYRRPVTLREAAFSVMRRAYLAASANNTLPANARQIYYAARPKILEIAERDSLDSQYFCQTLLVDYMQTYDVDWDVAWDDRGHFTEPHTGREIGLGTINVRQYLGDTGRRNMLKRGSAAHLSPRMGLMAALAPCSSSRRKASCNCSRRPFWLSDMTSPSCRAKE